MPAPTDHNGNGAGITSNSQPTVTLLNTIAQANHRRWTNQRAPSVDNFIGKLAQSQRRGQRKKKRPAYTLGERDSVRLAIRPIFPGRR
jgi:hypothetical protein